MRESIILSEVERDTVVKLDGMVHLSECAAAQYVHPEAFKHHHDRSTDLYHKVRALLQPYKYAISLEDSVADSLINEWKEVFGDPNSESVKATIKMLESGNV